MCRDSETVPPIRERRQTGSATSPPLASEVFHTSVVCQLPAVVFWNRTQPRDSAVACKILGLHSAATIHPPIYGTGMGSIFFESISVGC